MSLILNQKLTPFCDKKGKYVEILAILPKSLVLLYSEEKVDTVDISSSVLPTYNVGDKVYFDTNGNYVEIIHKEIIKPVSLDNNKQSPIKLPLDPHSRY